MIYILFFPVLYLVLLQTGLSHVTLNIPAMTEYIDEHDGPGRIISLSRKHSIINTRLSHCQ